MYDIHIEEFYRDCAVVLLQLYQSFPVKSSVFVEDVAGPDNPDEFGLHSPRFQACFGAMLWLESEGYMSFESTLRQEAIEQATLSALGLRLLNHLSDELAEEDNKLPNVEILRIALKNGTSTHLARLMIHLFSEYKNK